MSRVVLGKGLGALIPGDDNKAISENKFRTIALDQIEPNPMQPRTDFDEDSLRQLSQSLKDDGLMQPLVVKTNGQGYTIIAGERRFRAARMAELKEVPVVVMDEIDDGRMLELALIENLQREDLNPIETAEAYRRLIDDCNLTQNLLAQKVGKSRAAVANTIRLNNLPESIKTMLRSGQLSEGHARTILSLDSETAMLKAARQIIDGALTVRQAETMPGRKKRRRLIPKKNLPALVEVENYLKQLLGTSVKISPGLKRGKLEIEYYGDDDLNRLLEMFKKIEN